MSKKKQKQKTNKVGRSEMKETKTERVQGNGCFKILTKDTHFMQLKTILESHLLNWGGAEVSGMSQALILCLLSTSARHCQGQVYDWLW